MSSLYYTAGAASGLVEGYVLLCRTLASELTGGKGLLGLGAPGEGDDAKQECPVMCEAELQDRIMQRIASVPRGMTAADLAAELASDPSVQAALPAGVEIQVDFVNENGDVLHPHELNDVFVGNGHAEGYGNGIHALELRPVRGIPRPNTRGGVVLRGAWWQSPEDELWTAGVGPIRHRRPAAARLYLSKFLMRQPLK